MIDTANLYIAYTTTSSKEEARFIAERLIDKKAAACCTISQPTESIYQWKGKLEREEEWTLIIKTTKEQLNHVEKIISQLHSYECPCLMVWPIKAAAKDYADWVKAQCSHIEQNL